MSAAKEEVELGSEEDKEGQSNGLLPGEELKAKVDEAMRCGASLVRASKCLPKLGIDYELYNSFPAFQAFADKQVERLFNLQSDLARALGIAIRMPGVGVSTRDYADYVIEAQDNIAEQAAILFDTMQKAERDEIVQVPAVILKAASTNSNARQRRVDAMQTFSTNIGTAISLAQKFREQREREIEMDMKEKPQKTYNMKIDNTSAPFVPKLKEKHHALEGRAGLVVVDDDESGRRKWTSDIDETEVEHPYTRELLNFVAPERQIRQAIPIMPNSIEDSFTMVATKEALDEMLGKLKIVEEFAVDLEHNEKRSFLGLTCLIQISTRNEDFIVDPFPIWGHVWTLNEVFANPKILKVFHGADNDIQWLQRDFGIHVVNMFDTYFAMKLLNYSKFSLAFLVAKHASVALDKHYQLADWRLRPLTSPMVKYAREDTHYLLYCYDVLREELLELPESYQSLNKVYEESAALCMKIYKKPMFNDKGYLTEIKTRFPLNSRQEYALYHLYALRDTIARNKDESRDFVLPNNMLLSLAETLPRDISGIYACCSPLPYAVREYLSEITKIMIDAREVEIKKKDMTFDELDDANEARGAINHKMDEISALLRSKIDFTHCKFNEERGDTCVPSDVTESSVIQEKSPKESFISIMLPSAESNTALVVIEDHSIKELDTCNEISNEIGNWATPFECYTLAIKEKKKQEDEARAAEEARKVDEQDDQPKKFFSHLDPTVCRKPVFDDKVSNLSELRMIDDDEEPACSKNEPEEEQVFDPSRFDEDQLLTKKSLKRKRQRALAARDIAVDVVLGDSKKAKVVEKAPETSSAAQDFDYSKEDSSAFYKPAKSASGNFDPFHQQMRGKGQTKKKRGKTAQRSATFRASTNRGAKR